MSTQLSKIDHIVVLMLENRSFDHMLGYLSLGGKLDIDGLTGKESNTYNGRRYSPRPLSTGKFKIDPRHDWGSVHRQLEDANGGFVKSFVEDSGGRADPGAIMDYYTQDQLPVYHELAQKYCICDRWFASVPGPTQPNRVYAMAGTTNGEKTNIVRKSFFDVPTIFDHLSAKGVSWACYAGQIATLRLIKKHKLHPPNTKRFVPHFANDCVDGTLPSVSWIDPVFGAIRDFRIPNDDHPPHDILRGQALVATVYALLQANPEQFRRTLLIVTYDEHGGFYDHVVPPPAEDDFPEFRRYGVRVPAFLISPWVGAGSVRHELFDHTSIIKTIIERFWTDTPVPNMGRRVAAANSLAVALNRKEPREDTGEIAVPSFLEGADEADKADELEPNDWQLDLRALADECRANGIPDDDL